MPGSSVSNIFFDLRLTLRILVVTDGAINLWDVPAEPQGNNEGFTLREMARALWDAPGNLYPYTNFVVDHAIHGAGNMVTTHRTEHDPETNRTRTWTQYDSFRFDNPNFKLSNYSEVWFFGYWPGNPSGNGVYSTPANRGQLSVAELKILEKWMNAGGGVFATGDHGLLGSMLAGDISRVSKMRRWFDRGLSDNVPSVDQSDRIDTIVPVTTVNGQPEAVFADQSDNVPKRLFLKRYSLWDGMIHISHTPSPLRSLTARYAPHPILCSPLGPINILPDHMHEGLVREDDEVVLDSIDHNDLKEFPGGANRPTPEVIAWSTVRGGDVIYDDLGFAKNVIHRVIPTTAAYDGARANVGRVVVDSTWHNWLDINVRGTGATDRRNPQTGQLEPATGLLGKNLELVHNYVRNIAQWLANPTERDWMRNGLFIHTIMNTGGWAGLINARLPLGQQATNVLGQNVAECTLNELIFGPWLSYQPYDSAPEGNAANLILPSKEFVSYHVLGALTETVFELARQLPRKNGTDDRMTEGDTVREFELITAQLNAARQAGMRSMISAWCEALDATTQYLSTFEQSVSSSPTDQAA